MKKSLRLLRSAFALSLLSIVVARAQSNQPFSVTATTADALSPLTVSASGSNMLTLFDNVVNSLGSFASLYGRPTNVSETFLGVRNAIVSSTNANRTSFTITFTPINVSQTFTGPTSQAVNDQVSDYFQKNGTDIYARFLKAIAAQSPIAVTDGNPNTATAAAASSTFTAQGFTAADEIVASLDAAADGGSGSASSKPRFGGLALGFNSGHFKAAEFEGDNYEASGNLLNFGIGDHVRLLLPFYANYVTLSDAKIYGFGSNIALPIRLKTITKECAWNWRVTPVGGVSFRGSQDLASGALLWQAGVANTLDYRAAPRLVVGVVNQFTVHRSIAIDQGDFHFDPQIDQQILKNGLRIVTPLTRRLIFDAFAVDTRFLKEAAVKSFETFGGSLSLRATQALNFSLAANYDTGSRYQAYSVGLTSAWRW